MTGRALKGLFLAGIAAFVGGCSTESTPTDTGGPTGNPILSILSVNGVGGTPDGQCLAVPDGPDPTIPIEISTTFTIPSTGALITTLELRPPGYCAVLEEPQCGHLVALVNGVPNSESSTGVILVHLGKLANHYADLEITIQAVDDLEKPILTRGDTGAREPLVKTFKVTTSKSCPSSG